MQALIRSGQSAERRTEDAACELSGGHVAGRLIIGGLALLAVTAFVQSWPEIVRYMKMRNM
jgi:uncharacterized protein DUF6893